MFLNDGRARVAHVLEQFGVGLALDPRHDDGEFVAAEAGDGIGRAGDRGQARADLAAARAAKATTALKQSEALLEQAEADLERTVIRAPVDGIVVLRNADVGQRVAPGAQAPALFAISPDLHTVEIEAALDGTAALRPGMAVAFSVDALPRNASGKLQHFRLRESLEVAQ